MENGQIKLDFRSGVPIYLQIVQHIQDRLAGGQLKPGDQLPTVRQMALDLRINFNTVARAYRLLDEESLISTQQGRGTYILELPSPEDREQLRRKALEALVARALSEARRLGFGLEEIREVTTRLAVQPPADTEPGETDNDTDQERKE